MNVPPQSIRDSGYTLGPLEGPLRRLAGGWLLLGLGALLASGVYVLLVVVSRTPGVQGLVPGEDFFHTALVVHVDLSVLVWFLAFAGFLWSQNVRPRGLALAWLALALSATGAAGMAASPFLGASQPLMTNYVVILQHPLFFLSLGLLGTGFLLLILHTLMMARPVGPFVTDEGVLRFGLHAALVAAALAAGAFLWSYLAYPTYLQGKELYELLFWGGGHTLQYTHVLLMLVAWLWLARLGELPRPLPPRAALVILVLALFPALGTPFVYLAYPLDSPEHREALTWLMQFGGGLGALPLGLALVWSWLRAAAPSDTRAGGARLAMGSSVALFGVGGVVGYLIVGSDVTVPAHYHGSVVAVTLAFMGLTYQLLPRFHLGWPPPRLARIQPPLYGIGTGIHLLGLAWSGINGVQRKTAGADQQLESWAELAGMGLMAVGGAIAVAGGSLFVLVVIMALGRRRSERPDQAEHHQRQDQEDHEEDQGPVSEGLPAGPLAHTD